MAEVKENAHKDDKFSSQKPLGVNGAIEFDKDLKDIPIGKSSDHRFYCFDCGLAKNHNDSGSTTNAQDDEDIKDIKVSKEHEAKTVPVTKERNGISQKDLTKPKDDKDLNEISIAKKIGVDDIDLKGLPVAKEHKEGCPCNKESNPPKSGVRGLGAGATAVQGAGHSAQISEEKKDEGVSAESLGNPDKLKKPGDI